jgi:hypothetical protein
MHIRYVVAVGSFAMAVLHAPVRAQGTVAEPPRWSLSLGIDPANSDLNTRDPGVDVRAVANLTRSWQSRNSKWSRHISLMVGAEAPHTIRPFFYSVGFDSPQFASECNCSIRYADRYAALTVGASYDLLHAWRFTPYLTAGTGVYYTGVRRSAAHGEMPPGFPYYSQAFSQDKLALGANGGLGLKMRLSSHELFIEQMLHELDLRRQPGRAITPLNVGIRF